MSDGDIVNIFKQTEEHILKVGEIAADAPIGEKQVNNRLQRLEEEGVLDYKDVGSGRVWWLSHDPSSQ